MSLQQKRLSFEERDLVYRWLNDSTGGRSLIRSARLTTLNAYLIRNFTGECIEDLSWRVSSAQENVARLFFI
ncbi:unnamed protein product [Cyprideis torosa]|uniref:Uncharacterized protein n=1 Tax=Cyprideis torosa TaxID=163714 RepID=A0A7R8WB50_9CRUS|nr:unnamed protein product [Cyprideis torosa]CAG0886073.1 unnamed protein product [Cyprideis torosa]